VAVKEIQTKEIKTVKEIQIRNSNYCTEEIISRKEE